MNVICYIDGFNLYHGLRSRGWRKYYWLDAWALSERFLRRSQTLAEVVYCTTRIKDDPEGQTRQRVFISALQAMRPRLKVVYGHYLAKQHRCFTCGAVYTRHEEKMTDVNIACHLLVDAMDDRFDTAFVLSGDSDLVPPIKGVRQRWPRKQVIALFPPNRYSDALKRAAHGHVWIGEDKLRASQLPPEVRLPSGGVAKRPAEWA